MKKLVLSLFLLSLFAFQANAQETSAPAAEFEQAQVVATVSIQKAGITGQDGSKIDIVFDLSNQEKAQPDIRYAVQLAKETADSREIIDQYVYPEVISLNQNESVTKRIAYDAPAYLNGKYVLRLLSANSSGMYLSRVKLGEVELSGNGEYLEVVGSSCYLTVSGEKDKKYNLTQGVDIKSEESLIANCDVMNNFDRDIVAVASFKTLARNIFGKEVQVDGVSAQPLVLKKKEKTSISFTLPKPKTPQAYDALMSLSTPNSDASNSVAMHYVLSGASATIKNVLLDKASYASGETAKVSLYWAGTASNFEGSRAGNTGQEKITVEISINDGLSAKCSDVVTQALTSGVQISEMNVPITLDCKSPNVSIALKDQQGNVLDSKNLIIENKAAPAAENKVADAIKQSSALKVVLMMLFVVILVAVIVFVVIKKTKRSDNLPLGIFAGLLMAGYLLLGSGAEAITWMESNGFEYEATLDKLQYLPSENIHAEGSSRDATCGNYGLSSSSMRVVINGTTVQMFSDAFLFGEGVADVPAQSADGSYAAVFNSRVNNPITYTVRSASPRCGAANGGSFASAPSASLCSVGSASAVSTNSATYTWTCTSGSNTPALCSANKLNRAPTVPTLGGMDIGLVNRQFDFSAVSTDPDGDTLRYGFDWNRDGTVDLYSPASGYVASGTSQTAKNPVNQWTTVGTKTFQVRTQDSRGAVSGWATKSIIIGVAPTPTLNFSAAPSSVQVNAPVTLTWNTTHADTCWKSSSHPGTDGGWNGDWIGVSGPITVRPTAAGTIRYSLRCYNNTTHASVEKDATVSVVAPPCTPVWSVNPAIVCSGTPFTQTNQCNSATRPAVGTMNCALPCTPIWTVDPSTICSGTPFTQTNQCNSTTRPAVGTMNCALPCTPIWTADPTTICSGQPFTQTNQCNSTTRAAIGTKLCVADPTLNFSSNSASITLGSSATLTWATTSAASCWATSNLPATDGGWTTVPNGIWKAVNGPQLVTPTAVGTYTYSLQCANSATPRVLVGPRTATITVTAPVQAAVPTFSPAPGSYASTQTVSISTMTPGSTIHYTLDGTNPTASSAIYSTPLSIASTTTVKAITVKAGMTNSNIATAAYTISCTPTYSGRNCSLSGASVDCSVPANCGQTSVQSGRCSRINSCTGAPEWRPDSECSPACPSSSTACPACAGSNPDINWRETTP